VTLQELKERVDAAMDEGWSSGDDGEEFYTSIAAAAVMSIPLIAAAQDLLAACQRAERLLMQIEGLDPVVDSALTQIRAAVAKAEHGT